MPAPKNGEFWHIDLTRLSLTGCLLMLVTIAFAFGGLLIAIALVPKDWDDVSKKRVGMVALFVSGGLAALLFAAARRWLDKIGMPILRRPTGRR